MAAGIVDLAFFPDWKDGDTLLLAADAATLSLLEPPLLDLSLSRCDEIRLHELPFVCGHNGIALVARCVAVDSGTSRERGTMGFRWARSPAGWAAALSRVRGLIASRRASCHDYLDGPDDEVTVEISAGEYTHEWLQSMQRQA